MTIETITDLIHEYMYDRLNDSNNSNDGRGKQHVHERQYKRKWSDKSIHETPKEELSIGTQNTKTSHAEWKSND